jgi:hypothetical protein
MGDADGSATVTFGKHKGRSYADVLQEEPYYCQYILGQADSGESSNPNFLAFATWLRSQDVPDGPSGMGDAGGSGTVGFGKHKGTSYEKVLQGDQEYCQFVLNQVDTPRSTAFSSFRNWLITQIPDPEADQTNGA